MPFNGSGSFSPPGADFPAVANTLIESSKFNSVINDIATGLSTCITKNGQTTVTANIPFGGFRLTNIAAGAASTDAARVSQIQAGSLKIISSWSGTDTITGTLAPAITAYAKGMVVTAVAAGTNTGAATLNLNSVGAIAIVKNAPGGYAALVAGDIVSGLTYSFMYDDAGSDQWVLLNPGIPNVGGLVVTGNTTLGDAAADSVTVNAETVSQPNIPCFQAQNSATDTNQTGNGAVATVQFDTETFDQSGDFASNTFTAPATGRYLLSAKVRAAAIPAGATSANMAIVTSNRSYNNFHVFTAGSFTTTDWNLTVIADMDVGDTATVTLTISGGAGDTASIIGGTGGATMFCGMRVA